MEWAFAEQQQLFIPLLILGAPKEKRWTLPTTPTQY